MANAVWSYAGGKAGVRRHDPASWPEGPLGLSWKSLKRHGAFNALVENNSRCERLSTLSSAQTNGPSPNPGAPILLTLPKPGAWVLPGTWHMDGGFERPSWPVYGVKLFTFFGEVGRRVVARWSCPAPTAWSTNTVAGFRRAQALAWPTGTGCSGNTLSWPSCLTVDRMPDGGRSLVGQVGDVEKGSRSRYANSQVSLGMWS